VIGGLGVWENTNVEELREGVEVVVAGLGARRRGPGARGTGLHVVVDVV
jgi:hypothetical protein